MIREKDVTVDTHLNAVHQLEQTTLLDRTLRATRNLFVRTMLPVGYPDSVHPNYVKFNWWSFVQGVAGSASGVLATQCLLVGLGMSAPAPSSGGLSSTIALAATINWILKDGLGNLGGILFVTKFGSFFDRDAKRYRFFSAIAINFATFLEMLVPLLPQLFLPLASFANMCKSVSWMANSATRAQIQRHFTKLDNLGDLTGKAASVNTAAIVCGTGLGVALSSLFLSSITTLTPIALVGRCLLISTPLILVHLWANYLSCALGVSPRLSLQKLDIIYKGLVRNILGTKGELDEQKLAELSRYIIDPTAASKKERFLYLPWNKKGLSSVSFEPSAAILLSSVLVDDQQEAGYVKFFKENSFVAVHDQEGRLCVWFSEGKPDSDVITDLLTVYIARELYGHGEPWMTCLTKALGYFEAVGPSFLLSCLAEKNWDIQSSLAVSRHPIKIETDAT